MVKKNQKRIPASLQPWIDARRRFHLSHEHVQMARELGMNPKSSGSWTTITKSHGSCLCRNSFASFISSGSRLG
jgi:hypothetical protein